MVMAIKNAVTVKNKPRFCSTMAVTTKLEWMNSLTKKEEKPSKIARERQRRPVGSCEWT